MSLSITVNGQDRRVDAPSDTPLLWVLRDELQLTGTKFGCGIGQCGACLVHLAGAPVRSCQLPVSAIGTNAITTIEGLAKGGSLSAVQAAWIEEDVPQCGYCQAGQLMAATALLVRTPRPSDSEIDLAMTNICRCGTYPRIRAAIHRAASGLAK